MAISDTISISVEGTGEIGALADALDRAAGAAGKLQERLGKGLGAGAGAGKLADSYDAAFAKIQAGIDKLDKSMAGLGKAGGGADAGAASLGKIADASKVAAEQADAMAASVARADDALKGAGGTAAKAATATARYADASKAAAETSAGLGDASAGTAAGLDAQAAAAARSRDVLAETAVASDKAAVSASRAGKASAASAESGGWGTLKTALLGVGVAGAYGIDKAMKFQSEMLLLHTQAGVSVKDTATMSQGVLKISTETGQSLSSVAESAYHVASNMASMGTSVPKQLEVVRMAAEGAAIGHSNLVDTTNALTSVVASGIPGAKNYAQAMGMINATVGSGDMKMQDLAESMSSGVVPIVKGYGLNLKDVGAALATFGDLNIRGANAGTDLRTSVQALSSPMKTAKVQMAELGLTQNTLARDMEKGGLTGALDDLSGRFKKAGLTASTEGQVITELFGKKAGPGLAVLLENMDRYHSKLPVLTQDANNFNKAWEATQATPQQKWKELTAGFQAAAVNFGTELLPAFSGAVGFADKILADLNGSKGAWKDIAIGAGGLAAVFSAKKLVSGVESAFQTATTGLRFTGKILGLDSLTNLGKDTGLGSLAGSAAAASGGLDAVGGAADGAAAALARISGAVPGGLPGEKPGGIPGPGEPIPVGGPGEPLPAEKPGKSGPGVLPTIGAVASGILTGAIVDYIGGHITSAFLAKPTPGQVKQYQQDTPGWLQAIANAEFGKPGAASLRENYGHAARTAAGNWLSDLFGGPGGAQPPGFLGPPAPGTQFHQAGAIPAAWAGLQRDVVNPVDRYFGSIGSGIKQGFQSDVSNVEHFFGGLFGGGIPATRSAAQLPGPSSAPDQLGGVGRPGTVTIKPKVEPPDASALAGFSSMLASAMHLKPVKMPPPDMSAMKAAVGAAAADGAAAGAGFASGVRSMTGAAAAAGASVAAAAEAAMKVHLQISSPSKVTQKIGAQAVEGLITGLQGGQPALQAAAAALGRTVAKAADVTAIEGAISKAIGYAGKDSALVRMLKADQGKLEQYAAQRAKLEQEITDSTQIAQSAVSGASILGAGAYTPAMAGGPQSAQSVITGLGYMAGDQTAFAKSLQQLAKMGLNDTSLSQLAQAGAQQGLPVAEGLAQGGKGAVTQVNALEKTIMKGAAAVGDTGGPAMYQAGAQLGQMAASGLKSSLGAVDAAMKALGQRIIADLDKELHIKQPAHPAHGAGGTVHHHHTTHVHVHTGAVLSSNADLYSHMQQAALQFGSNNWSAGLILPGRHT